MLVFTVGIHRNC